MHEGHRRRMYDKLKNDSGLYDHELLEILLFNAFPRHNTNPISHALLNAFGSLSGVFEAELEELTAVDGVGERVALFIKCVGECMKRTADRSPGVAVLKSYEDFKNFAVLRMRGKVEEVLELYCLEKSGRIKKIYTFSDNDRNRVEVDTDKVANALAATKPYGLLIAHNHLSGDSSPSVNDDRFTMEIQLICSMNNINLYDHCIYASDGNLYSYFSVGKIDEIKREFSYKKLVDGLYKKNIIDNKNKK